MFFYVLLILGCVSCFEMPPTWLNPADLHHSRKIVDKAEPIMPSKPEILPTEPVISCESATEKKNESCVCPPTKPSACHSYMKRLINLILIKTSMKDFRLPKDEVRNVPVKFLFNTENLEILHAFASSENEKSFSWSEFDQAISSLFEEDVVNKNEDNMSSPPVDPQRDNTVTIFISIVGSMLLIGLWLLLTSGSVYKAICGISLIGFCCSFVWNLIRAYNLEKARIIQAYTTNLNGSEGPKTWSWVDYLPFPFLQKSNGPELPAGVDPMFNLDFGKIFIETICSVFQILPVLGEKVGAMVSNFYGEQDWITRYVVKPIQFVCNPVLLVIFVLLYAIITSGFTIRLPFFTLDINKKDGGIESKERKKQSPTKKKDTRGQASIQNQGQVSIQNQGQANIQNQGQASIQNQGQASFQNQSYTAPVQNNVAGPSTSNPPYVLKRVTNEEYIYSDPNIGASHYHSRAAVVTSTRKGPWQGTVFRYGFVKKRTAASKEKHNNRQKEDSTRAIKDRGPLD